MVPAYCQTKTETERYQRNDKKTIFKRTSSLQRHNRYIHILKKYNYGDIRLTTSGFDRAKMAKVESPSHTHLVLNESIGTALQFRGDQEPSRERLHRGQKQSEEWVVRQEEFLRKGLKLTSFSVPDVSHRENSCKERGGWAPVMYACQCTLSFCANQCTKFRKCIPGSYT